VVSRPRALGRRPVPHDSAEHTVLDECHTLLRCALEVEGLREPARVERVVGEREAPVEDLRADLVERVAPLLEQALRAEGVVREVGQQLREGRRLEHRRVGARLELDRSTRELRLLDRRRGGARGIDVGGAPARLLRVAGGAVDGGEREHGDVGRRL
jgi:hypothetical protein